MPAQSSFDYAVVRVVPRAEREEFVNAGVIVFCTKKDFLGAKVAADLSRVKALDPSFDEAEVRSHLASIPRICTGGVDAGPIGQLAQKERFHWLVAPRSTIIQVSPVHSGLCDDPAEALARLFAQMVGPA